IAYRLDRSFAWNASHPPKLPPRPRKMPTGPGVTIFGHRLDNPVGIAAGPLLNSKWIEAYARLGYSLLTYKTVRTAAHPALPHPPPRPPRRPARRRARPAAARPGARHLGGLDGPTLGRARRVARRRRPRQVEAPPRTDADRERGRHAGPRRAPGAARRRLRA